MGKAELTLDGLVDQAGDRFERELESGDRPSLEAFLEGHDSQARMALLQELLTLEVEHRCAAGETPDLQAYLIRFPDEQTVVEKVFHVLTEIESRSMNDESTDHPDARDTRKKLEDNADQFVGQTIGRYEVRKHLGQGGMGVVLLAWHPVMERLVALKLLPEKAARNQTFMQRFRREVQTIARLSHQNIVVAYDADEAEGQHFLVMEFVDGRDLGVLVKADGPVSVAQAMDFIRQAATGLEYAHKKGVTHRRFVPRPAGG